MKLQTTIPLKQSDRPIDYDSDLLLVGSCFVEHIGAKLTDFKFKSLTNPFGILFHPEAIARLFERAVSQEQFTVLDVELVEDYYVSLDAHSNLNASTDSTVVLNLNTALEDFQHKIKKASHVIITLGTAWGYRHISHNKIVANCHKIPQNKFTKELASVVEVEHALNRIVKAVEAINPEASVIFTISPVRHLKDGFVENQRSKAHLITAVHAVITSNSKVQYFPSYEIMMDELRDYRFYDRDLIHPNELAVDYIWERFSFVYFASETQKKMLQVEEIQRGLRHRPFNPSSAQHKKFLRKLDDKITALKIQIPHIQF
ncbi:GSCFA domain-containing protein [Leeuwenhoekiella sp. W20_SRS_FM14]|uniref:GSCFA domain-containing protein n=1 Tax=Leeuwenhoekiella sp. W20_SRS_FM14 TaxID=3240270 RepID=UPI003F9BC28A